MTEIDTGRAHDLLRSGAMACARTPSACLIVGVLACGSPAGDATSESRTESTSPTTEVSESTASASSLATSNAAEGSTSSDTASSTASTQDTGMQDTGTGDTGEVPTDCSMVPCHFVLASALGAGDGSSWVDAFAVLPADLERGAVYFVGAGAYPAYTFDDAPDGGAVVTVRRATSADHGTDAGWDDTFGSDPASFASTLVIEQGDFVFDGSTRNEADWFDPDAYGFRIAHDGQDQNIVIANYGVSIDNVTIRNVFVDAIVENLPDTTIRRYAIDTDGFDGGSTATNLVFSRMFVRGSNNVWFLRTTDGAIVEYCASDGVASNSANHGEIVNLYYSGNNAIVRFNHWRNAFLPPGGGGTALVAITQADGLQFYGNVLRNFAVGDGAVGFDGYASSDNRIYHNTFVGNLGYNAGTAFGEGTGNLVYNNVWLDAGTVNLAGEHDFNAFGDDNARGEANAQTNLSPASFADVEAGDLHLIENTMPGMALGPPWDFDADGDARATWSRGAFEH